MSSDVSIRGGWGAIGIELIFADGQFGSTAKSATVIIAMRHAVIRARRQFRKAKTIKSSRLLLCCILAPVVAMRPPKFIMSIS
jgi:hypothetical protein